MVAYGAQASSGVIEQCEPQSRFEPMRRMSPFSAISSPMDDPGHYVYLYTSLSTFSNSDAVSEVEIAISHELAQSPYDLAHRDRTSSREIALSTSDTKS